jgi:hypothetical protein
MTENDILLDQLFWFYLFTGCTLVLGIRVLEEMYTAETGKPAPGKMDFLDHFLIALIWPAMIMMIVMLSGKKRNE